MADIEFGVKSNVKDVTEEVQDLKESVEDTKKATDKTSKSVEDLGKQKKSVSAIRGAFTKLSSVLKGALGLGVVVSLFAALKESIERNQTIMNTLNTIMTTVSTTFNQVVAVLVDTVTFVTASSDRFNGLTSVVKGLMTIGLTPLKLAFQTIKLAIQQGQLAWEQSFFGGKDEAKITELRLSIGETITDIENTGKAAINAGKDIVTNFGDAVSEIGDISKKVQEGISNVSIKANFEQAKTQTELKNNSALAIAENRKLIEQFDVQAEKQRQIRDDESATIEERIAANVKLGEILDDQEKAMLENADLIVASAQAEADANKNNIELQAALVDAEAEREGVIARVAGQRSEQLTNENSLLKEQKDLSRELFDFGMTEREQEILDLQQQMEDKLELARKLGKDEKKIKEFYAKEIAKSNKKFAQEDLNNQLSAASSLMGALGSLAGENKELAAASAIIDTYVGANKALAQGGPIAGPLLAASMIIQGLANVRKIYSTDAGDGGGGGREDLSVDSVQTEVPTTEIVQQTANLNIDPNNEPVRAFVVTDDITDSQDKLNNIRRKATI